MDNFILKTNLLNVLGGENRIYSYKEVLCLLKTYILANPKLIDSNDQDKIICKDDSLGKALGVEAFSVKDVKMLLMKCVFFVPVPERRKPTESEVLCGPSTSTSASQFANSSQCRNKIFFTLPEMSAYNSGDESIYSYQGYETAICDDDYEAESYHSEDADTNAEYEPVTDEDDHPIINETDSDAVSFVSGILVLDQSNFEEDCFADESDDVLDSDNSSTEDEPDKWACLTCGIHNRPYMPYCLKCWKERKEWFPERPMRKRRRKSRPKKDRRSIESLKSSNGECATSNNLKQIVGYNIKSTELGSTTGSFSSQDSGVVCSQDSEMAFSQESECVPTQSSEARCLLEHEMDIVLDSVESTKCNNIRERDSDIDDPPLKYPRLFDTKQLRDISLKFRKFASTKKGRKWMNSSRADDLRERIKPMESDSETEIFVRKFHKFSSSYAGRRWVQSTDAGVEFLENLDQISSNSDSDVSDHKCRICLCKAANASLIHGSISHLGFCYSCAKRLITTNSRCPACRRKIDRITKNCYF